MITRAPDGTVRDEETVNDTPEYVYIAGNGVFETGFIDLSTGERNSFTYTFPTDDLLPLKPWSGREGEQVTLDGDGTETNRIPFSYRTRGETVEELGGCTFTIIPLETYYFEPGDPSMVEFRYVVELGVPVNVGYAYLNGGIGSAEPYHPVSISAVAE